MLMQAILLGGAMAALQGCTSAPAQPARDAWTFQNVSTDDALPADFTKRTVYGDSSAVRGNLPDFIGHAIEIDKDGNAKKISAGRFVVNDTKPPIVPIDAASGQIYSSKIDKQFKESGSASYLVASISTSMSNDDMLEVIIRDVATSSLDSDKIDQQKLAAFAKSLPAKAGVQRCFVQGVRIASISYRKYAKADANAKVAAGTAFQAGGAVYNTSEQFTGDYKLSIDCIDLDILRPLVSAVGLSEDPKGVFSNVAQLRPSRALLLTSGTPQEVLK
jgi:hypothetical protein